MPDLETLFTPQDLAYLDYLPDNAFEKFSENYRELQALEKEVAAFLPGHRPKKRRRRLAGTAESDPTHLFWEIVFFPGIGLFSY